MILKKKKNLKKSKNKNKKKKKKKKNYFEKKKIIFMDLFLTFKVNLRVFYFISIVILKGVE
jgi:hypothetical protein